jgi:hypothetical protein
VSLCLGASVPIRMAHGVRFAVVGVLSVEDETELWSKHVYLTIIIVTNSIQLDP